MSVPQTKHIYYNARLVNEADPDRVAPTIPAKFNDSRSCALLSRASDYDMSIIRFTTSLETLPALLVEHPPVSNAYPLGTTAYTFTIRAVGVDYPATVIWTPTSNIPRGNGSVYDKWWWCYDFIYFTSLVNQAIANACNTANIPAPFFQYDVQTATFSLYAPDMFNGTTYQLFADPQAYRLYGGFNVFTSNTPGKEYRYIITLQPAETPVLIDGVTYIKRDQIPNSAVSWNPVRRFVFTTSMLPSVPESTNANGISSALGSLTSQNVIADLTPEMPRADSLRTGTLEYTPTAQYRFISLASSDSIQTIQLQLYWEDSFGNLHEHLLADGGYVSVKILFERRTLN